MDIWLGFWGWLTSASVLETVFGGVLGSVIGALVAMAVLRFSLAAQNKHHQEQLSVQREENARERLHGVLSDILAVNTRIVIAFRHEGRLPPDNELSSVLRELPLNLERLKLETPNADDGMVREIRTFTLILVAVCGLAFTEHAQPRKIPGVLASFLSEILVPWAKGTPEDRAAALQILTEANIRANQHDFGSVEPLLMGLRDRGLRDLAAHLRNGGIPAPA